MVRPDSRLDGDRAASSGALPVRVAAARARRVMAARRRTRAARRAASARPVGGAHPHSGALADYSRPTRSPAARRVAPCASRTRTRQRKRSIGHCASLCTCFVRFASYNLSLRFYYHSYISLITVRIIVVRVSMCRVVSAVESSALDTSSALD